jgi:stress-induced morphogen
VDLKEKVEESLRRHFLPELVQLNDDEGVYGVVVSSQFRGKSALERQKMIHKALTDSSMEFSKPELRRVLAIAALTSAEYYETVGHRD